MKSTYLCILIAITFSVSCCSGQGTFQNLGFESANLSPIPQGQVGSFVPVSAALPGWTVFLGSSQASQVLQNNASTGDPEVDILGPNFGNGPGGVIEGNYTAVLQAGGSGTHVPATIEQTGFVPSTAKSIQMKFGPGTTGYEVTLGGQEITMSPLAENPNYTLYGGVIPTGLIGTTQELAISALPTPTDAFNGFPVDSIVFSPNAVPEPTIWSLLLCSASLLAIRRLK
ncbi:MAG TPA: hypothetical protein VH413_08990 [Verrucomicrobiae bacterium]|jgi:hypothetical protein|nr:hypothetical protein [Verrucomicrobiae bacterium]